MAANITIPVDCQQCRHFYITWDKRFPYGCRKMGFKGKRMPSQEVQESSGQHCLQFHNKSTANVHKN